MILDIKMSYNDILSDDIGEQGKLDLPKLINIYDL